MHGLIGLPRRRRAAAGSAATVPARQEGRILPSHAQRFGDGFAHVILPQAVGQAVDGHIARPFDTARLDVRRIHLPAAVIRIHLAESRHGHALAELALLEGLVEPDQLDEARAVRNGHLEDGQSPPRLQRLNLAHRSRNEDGQSRRRLRLSDRQDMAPVFILAREILQQVRYRSDAELMEKACLTGPDALYVLYRKIH